MKLTYFGTAAAEGFPAVFCNCDYCNSRSNSHACVVEFKSEGCADTMHLQFEKYNRCSPELLR